MILWRTLILSLLWSKSYALFLSAVYHDRIDCSLFNYYSIDWMICCLLHIFRTVTYSSKCKLQVKCSDWLNQTEFQKNCYFICRIEKHFLFMKIHNCIFDEYFYEDCRRNSIISNWICNKFYIKRNFVDMGFISVKAFKLEKLSYIDQYLS